MLVYAGWEIWVYAAHGWLFWVFCLFFLFSCTNIVWELRLNKRPS